MVHVTERQEQTPVLDPSLSRRHLRTAAKGCGKLAATSKRECASARRWH